MITYNGNGGMDTVAVGLNERGSTLRQLPEGDVQLIRAYAGQHPEILQHTSLHVFRPGQDLFPHRPGREAHPLFDV